METFDTDKYALGRLCAFNHKYQLTKNSLRFANGYRSCVRCDELRKADPILFKKTIQTIYRAKPSQKAALKRWKQTEKGRATLKRGSMLCKKRKQQQWLQKNQPTIDGYSYDKTKYFIGKLCALKHHEFGTTGQSLRKIHHRMCKICDELGSREVSRLRSLQYNRTSHGKIIRKKYDQSDIGKKSIRACHLKYMSNPINKKKTKQKVKEYLAKPEIREKLRKQSQHERDTLHTKYIKDILVHTQKTPLQEITPELIRLKREQLQFTRKLTTIKKELKTWV